MAYVVQEMARVAFLVSISPYQTIMENWRFLSGRVSQWLLLNSVCGEWLAHFRQSVNNHFEENRVIFQVLAAVNGFV